MDHLPLLADLRDWNSIESNRGLEESHTNCAADEDVADLCRDACGNPLVPNWTNLQELESRRRRTTGSSLGMETLRCRRTNQSNRQPNRSEAVGDSSSHECSGVASQRAPGSNAPLQEPAASSCLNVCTLASRLQLQSVPVESCAATASRSLVGGTNRPGTRPNQVSFAQERDSEDTCVFRPSTTAPSGGLRNLGQTARTLITDLLRSNSSNTAIQPVNNPNGMAHHAQESTGQTRVHTGTRSVVASPSTFRIQNQCVRQEERTNRTSEYGTSTCSRGPRSRDVSILHHSQRREVSFTLIHKSPNSVPLPRPQTR